MSAYYESERIIGSPESLPAPDLVMEKIRNLNTMGLLKIMYDMPPPDIGDEAKLPQNPHTNNDPSSVLIHN